MEKLQPTDTCSPKLLVSLRNCTQPARGYKQPGTDAVRRNNTCPARRKLAGYNCHAPETLVRELIVLHKYKTSTELADYQSTLCFVGIPRLCSRDNAASSAASTDLQNPGAPSLSSPWSARNLDRR